MRQTLPKWRSKNAFRYVWVLALAGCGGRVGENPAGTATPTPTTTVTPSTTTSPPPAPPPTPVCRETADGASVTLTDYSGVKTTCRGTGLDTPKTINKMGRVTTITGNTLTIDSCPPGAACDEVAIATLEVGAAGLDLRTLGLRADYIVNITLEFERGWTCGTHLQVDSVATWDTYRSPDFSAPRHVLTVDDGTTKPAPITVRRELLSGCAKDMRSCGGPAPGAYQFLVGSSNKPAPMGTSITVIEGSFPYTFHNLRSLESGLCDDYWQYAYWIVGQEPLDG